MIDCKSGAGAPHSKGFSSGGVCGKLADAFASCDGESGRIRVNRIAIVVGAVVIAVNKWDIAKEKDRRKFLEDLHDRLKFLDYAPILFASARFGACARHLNTWRRNAPASSCLI